MKVLIEHTAFAILAPSDGTVHPSGRPYVRRSGGFHTIAFITEEEHEALLALARSFDEVARTVTPPSTGAVRRPATDLSRPGDAFAKVTPWSAVLEPKGWSKVCDRGHVGLWRRPGKSFGVSATTNFAGSDLFYVFTSSTEFDPERAYSKFAVYAILNHGGDFTAAASALAAQGHGGALEFLEVVSSSGIATQPQQTENSENTPGPITFTPLSELLAQPDDVVAWVVPDRIASGSVNVLAGKPKAGKSTLARDLALAVARGGDWIGHSCVAGPVWYLVFEDKRAEVRRHFRQMGAVGDEPVRFLFDQPGDQLIPKLQALAEQEHPSLIIVDTLQRLIRARDLNDYAEVTVRLTPLLVLRVLPVLPSCWCITPAKRLARGLTRFSGLRPLRGLSTIFLFSTALAGIACWHPPSGLGRT